MQTDNRFLQRFSNYKKAFAQLTEFIEKGELNKLEVQGLIQCFEYTFELAWKTIKDYLEQQGFDVKSPRSAIQIAFQTQLIKEGHIWIDALEKRNLMAHTYDETIASEAQKLIISEYYPRLKELLSDLEELTCSTD